VPNSEHRALFLSGRHLGVSLEKAVEGRLRASAGWAIAKDQRTRSWPDMREGDENRNLDLDA
jgi:hypothetical protein